jgi:hypothetical protein
LRPKTLSIKSFVRVLTGGRGEGTLMELAMGPLYRSANDGDGGCIDRGLWKQCPLGGDVSLPARRNKSFWAYLVGLCTQIIVLQVVTHQTGLRPSFLRKSEAL